MPSVKISRDTLLEHWGGRLVIIGLLVEIGLAVYFHPNEPWYERWSLVLANVLIAIGVWMEIHFGGNVQAEANARTAEANERAEEAKLAHEKLKAQLAWRELPRIKETDSFLLSPLGAQGTVLALSIELRGKGDAVVIMYAADDSESRNFVEYFHAAFKMARWEVALIGCEFPGKRVTGIRIPGAGVATPDWSKAVQDAFTKVGIEFVDGHFGSPNRQVSIEGKIGTPNCIIYIGPRPIAE